MIPMWKPAPMSLQTVDDFGNFPHFETFFEVVDYSATFFGVVDRKTVDQIRRLFRPLGECRWDRFAEDEIRRTDKKQDFRFRYEVTPELFGENISDLECLRLNCCDKHSVENSAESFLILKVDLARVD
jgi:hypothetical protein